MLDRPFRSPGKAQLIRSDNGREFIATSVGAWWLERGVQTAFVEKGSPQQNGFVERFNKTMSDNLLKGEEFETLTEARIVIGRWTIEYTWHRPHRGRGFLTPFQFAGQARKESAVARSKSWV